MAEHQKLARVRTPRRVLIALAALSWMGGIAFGVAQVHDFESTPGDSKPTPPIWPSESKIKPDSKHATLVMLIHPECACSRASLAELEQVMTRAQGRVAAWVLLAQSGTDAHSSLRAQAQRIPGVRVDADVHGAEAARFGALTSGHVVLYDAAGHLRFSGGITSARGHEGENMGDQQLLASLTDVGEKSAAHPVFGCALTKSDIQKETNPAISGLGQQ